MSLRSEIEYIHNEELSDSPFNVPFIAEVHLGGVVYSNKMLKGTEPLGLLHSKTTLDFSH